MSLLGFDAIGRLALGQIPKSKLVTLPALAASYAEAGRAATFLLEIEAIAASYSLAGNDAAFSTNLAVTGAAYAEAGSAATFLTTLGTLAASYAVAGFPTGAIGLVADPGAFIVDSPPGGFTVSEGAQAGSYVFTGHAADLTRDFINWFPRPFDGSEWTGDPIPSSGWTAANSQGASWNNKGAPSSAWSPIARPSTPWTVDPAQQILPPVNE